MTEFQKAFVVHTVEPGGVESTLAEVLRLSNRIFDEETSTPTHHSSLEEWVTRLNRPASIVAYGVSDDTGPPLLQQEFVVKDAAPIIGFIFAHIKNDRALPCPTLHIWLAGVDSSARGTGVFAMLMDRVERHARSVGLEGLSVATFPDKFAKMYSILQRQGWKVQDWREDGKKVLMMKAL